MQAAVGSMREHEESEMKCCGEPPKFGRDTDGAGLAPSDKPSMLAIE